MRFFVGLATILVFVYSSVFTQIDIPSSSFEKFNERGFSTSASFSARGNEIISDYDGNFSLQYSITPDLPEELSGALTITYNSNVDHRIIGQNGGEYPLHNFNAGEWILGFKGFALQALNFEVNHIANDVNEPFTQCEGSELTMLITGYHFSNRASYEMPPTSLPPGSEGFSGHNVDHIRLFTADGSIKCFYKANKINWHLENYGINDDPIASSGLYVEPGRFNAGYAYVNYNPNLEFYNCVTHEPLQGNIFRELWYKPGDGLTYLFVEEYPHLAGADTCYRYDVKCFYLKKIIAKSGWSLEFDYTDVIKKSGIEYNITNGRKVISSISLNNPENNELHKVNILNFYYNIENNKISDIYICDRKTIPKLWEEYSSPPDKYYYRLHIDNTANQNNLFKLEENKYISDIQRYSAGNRRLMVNGISDYLGNFDEISYTTQERLFRYNNSNDLYKLVRFDIGEINYSNGKKTRISYYDKFDNLAADELILSSPYYNYIVKNMNAAYRDCHTNSIVKSVEVFERDYASLIFKDTYFYEISGSATWESVKRDPIITGILTKKIRLGGVNNWSGTPYQGIESIKEFGRYRHSDFDYTLNDRSCLTRLLNEKVYPVGSDYSNNGSETIHQWRLGTQIGSGENGYFNGRFTKKSTTKLTYEQGNSIDQTQIFPENAQTYVPIIFSTKNTKYVPELKIEKAEGFEIDKIKTTKFCNIFPETETEFSDINFPYILGLPEYEMVYNNLLDSALSKTSYEYYENSTPTKNHKLKTKILNAHTANMAEDRTVRTEYEYYDMDDNPYYVHYNGFLKSTKIDDPGNNHFSRVTYKYNEFLTAYPEFEAKKLFDNGEIDDYRPHQRYNGFRPFKTEYEMSEEGYVIHRQYTGFNSRGELEWEVGPDGYYSEFKYDDAGRIISAAFPGGFRTENMPTRRSLQYYGIRNYVVDNNYEKICPKPCCEFCVDDGISVFTELFSHNVSAGGGGATDSPSEGFTQDAEESGGTDQPGGQILPDIHYYYYIALDEEIIGAKISEIYSATLTLETGDYNLYDCYQTPTFAIEGITSPMEDHFSYGKTSPISVTFQENTTMTIDVALILSEVMNNMQALYGFRLKTNANLPSGAQKTFKRFHFAGGDSQPLLELDVKIEGFGNIDDGTVFYEYNDLNNSVIQKRLIEVSGISRDFETKKINYNCLGEISTAQTYDGQNYITDATNYYNYMNKPYKTVDAEGRATYFSYDYLGRLRKQGFYEDLGNNPHVSTDYFVESDPLSGEKFLIEKIIDETRVNWTRNIKDKLGNLLKTEKYNDGEIITTRYEYDDFYRLKKVISPDGYETFFLYDELSNLAAKKTPHAGTYYYKFDKFGNMRYRIHNSSMMQSRMEYRRYDSYNRLTHVGLLYGNTAWSSLNPDEKPVGGQEIDANTMLLLNEYRSYSDYIAHDLFNNFSLPSEFNDDNNCHSGKLLATIYRNKADASEPWSFKAYKYDPLGRIIKFRQEFSGLSGVITQEYEYNHGGNLIQHDIDGDHLGTFSHFYEYDNLNRLRRCKSNMNPVKTNAIPDAEFMYNNSGQLTQHRFGFAPREYFTDYIYDSQKGWLLETKFQESTEPPFTNTVFGEYLSYFENGNISQQNITNNYSGPGWDDLTYNYAYDGLGRLTNVSGSHNETIYYQKDGRIAHRTINGDEMQYYYDTTMPDQTYRLRSIKYTEGSIQNSMFYTYDGRGNLISDERINNNDIILINYTWDNLPLSMLTNGQMINYKYDDAGQRICEDVNGAKEFFIRNYDGTEIGAVSLYEEELIEYKFKYFNLIGGGNIGRVECNWDTYMSGGIPYWTRTDDRFYYIKDHLGSIRLTIEDNGSLFAAQDYDPWGKITRSWNPSTPYEKFKFTGKELDSETDYHYFGARYYDSFKAQWTSPDPLEDKYPGLWSYNYVANNPIIFYDPDGQDIWVCSGLTLNSQLTGENSNYYDDDKMYVFQSKPLLDTYVGDLLGQMGYPQWRQVGTLMTEQYDNGDKFIAVDLEDGGWQKFSSLVKDDKNMSVRFAGANAIFDTLGDLAFIFTMSKEVIRAGGKVTLELGGKIVKDLFTLSDVKNLASSKDFLDLLKQSLPGSSIESWQNYLKEIEKDNVVTEVELSDE